MTRSLGSAPSSMNRTRIVNNAIDKCRKPSAVIRQCHNRHSAAAEGLKWPQQIAVTPNQQEEIELPITPAKKSPHHPVMLAVRRTTVLTGGVIGEPRPCTTGQENRSTALRAAHSWVGPQGYVFAAVPGILCRTKRRCDKARPAADCKCESCRAQRH